MWGTYLLKKHSLPEKDVKKTTLLSVARDESWCSVNKIVAIAIDIASIVPIKKRTSMCTELGLL